MYRSVRIASSTLYALQQWSLFSLLLSRHFQLTKWPSTYNIEAHNCSSFLSLNTWPFQHFWSLLHAELVSHVNLKLWQTQFTIDSLWLSGRASKCRIPRFGVQFFLCLTILARQKNFSLEGEFAWQSKPRLAGNQFFSWPSVFDSGVIN